MRTYKLGSRSLRHEEQITVPGLIWLGVKSSDIFDHNLHSTSWLQFSSQVRDESQSSETTVASIRLSSHQRSSDSSSGFTRTGRLSDIDYKINPLTSNDRHKAVSILNKVEDQEFLDAEDINLSRELQFMLMLNVKFEIQAVDDGGTMTRWLDARFSSFHHAERAGESYPNVS